MDPQLHGADNPWIVAQSMDPIRFGQANTLIVSDNSVHLQETPKDAVRKSCVPVAYACWAPVRSESTVWVGAIHNLNQLASSLD